jgi:hypothetical protein
MLSWNEVQCKAASIGVTNPSPDRYELIRQIQAAEGFTPCYKTKSACDQMQCCWRGECLGRRTTGRMPVVKSSGG